MSYIEIGYLPNCLPHDISQIDLRRLSGLLDRNQVVKQITMQTAEIQRHCQSAVDNILQAIDDFNKNLLPEQRFSIGQLQSAACSAIKSGRFHNKDIDTFEALKNLLDSKVREKKSIAAALTEAPRLSRAANIRGSVYMPGLGSQLIRKDNSIEEKIQKASESLNALRSLSLDKNFSTEINNPEVIYQEKCVALYLQIITMMSPAYDMLSPELISENLMKALMNGNSTYKNLQEIEAIIDTLHNENISGLISSKLKDAQESCPYKTGAAALSKRDSGAKVLSNTFFANPYASAGAEAQAWMQTALEIQKLMDYASYSVVALEVPIQLRNMVYAGSFWEHLKINTGALASLLCVLDNIIFFYRQNGVSDPEKIKQCYQLNNLLNSIILADKKTGQIARLPAFWMIAFVDYLTDDESEQNICDFSACKIKVFAVAMLSINMNDFDKIINSTLVCLPKFKNLMETLLKFFHKIFNRDYSQAGNWIKALQNDKKLLFSIAHNFLTVCNLCFKNYPQAVNQNNYLQVAQSSFARADQKLKESILARLANDLKTIGTEVVIPKQAEVGLVDILLQDINSGNKNEISPQVSNLLASHFPNDSDSYSVDMVLMVISKLFYNHDFIMAISCQKKEVEELRKRVLACNNARDFIGRANNNLKIYFAAINSQFESGDFVYENFSGVSLCGLNLNYNLNLKYKCFRGANFDALDCSSWDLSYCDLCGASFGCVDGNEVKYSLFSYSDPDNLSNLLKSKLKYLSGGYASNPENWYSYVVFPQKLQAASASLPSHIQELQPVWASLPNDPQKMQGIWLYSRNHLMVANNGPVLLTSMGSYKVVDNQRRVLDQETARKIYLNDGGFTNRFEYFAPTFFDMPLPGGSIHQALARENGANRLIELPQLPDQLLILQPAQSQYSSATIMVKQRPTPPPRPVSTSNPYATLPRNNKLSQFSQSKSQSESEFRARPLPRPPKT